MKGKYLVSIFLAAALAAGALTGCGGSASAGDPAAEGLETEIKSPQRAAARTRSPAALCPAHGGAPGTARGVPPPGSARPGAARGTPAAQRAVNSAQIAAAPRAARRVI